ncbi:Uncharacterized protein FKW44_023142, partial [Caligus rogercresseyi]
HSPLGLSILRHRGAAGFNGGNHQGWRHFPILLPHHVSCINLLRVLNKLTKWKQSRIM